MLFSKNLIVQNDNIASYNQMLRQVNNMQQLEQKEILKVADETEASFNTLRNQVAKVQNSINALVVQIQCIDNMLKGFEWSPESEKQPICDAAKFDANCSQTKPSECGQTVECIACFDQCIGQQ